VSRQALIKRAGLVAAGVALSTAVVLTGTQANARPPGNGSGDNGGSSSKSSPTSDSNVVQLAPSNSTRPKPTKSPSPSASPSASPSPSATPTATTNSSPSNTTSSSDPFYDTTYTTIGEICQTNYCVWPPDEPIPTSPLITSSRAPTSSTAP
jgi:hypothetical protein